MNRNSLLFLMIALLLTGCAAPTSIAAPIPATSNTASGETITPTPPFGSPTPEPLTATPEPTATETFAPFDLESKTCTVDDAPAILTAVQEKFHFSPDTPDGTLITNKETSPTYQGPMEVAYQCTLTGVMKDPSGREGDVSVDGLHLVVFHIKVAGQDAFLQLIFDDVTIKFVLNGNKIKTGRPGIYNGSVNDYMKKTDPQLVNLGYLEQYNNLGFLLAQIKQGTPVPYSIQSKAFVGVFFNP